MNERHGSARRGQSRGHGAYLQKYYLASQNLSRHIVEQVLAVEHSLYMPKQVTLCFPGWECYRCGYQWLPKRPGFEATVCPQCKSPFWKTPRRSSGSKTRAKRRQPKTTKSVAKLS